MDRKFQKLTMLDQAKRRLFLVFSYRLFAVSLINTRLIIQAKISFLLAC